MRRAEIYLPASALSVNDLNRRQELLRPAREQGFSTGLMLIVPHPAAYQGTDRQRQFDHLDHLVKLPQSERLMVFVYHPNQPLEGARGIQDGYNFLTNPSYSQAITEQAIDFTAALPNELTPDTGRALSVHLNTLTLPDPKSPQTADHWQRQFENVTRIVGDLVSYAATRHITLAIETVPLPEFGDYAKTRKTQLKDGVHYWSDLANPWPLLSWRGEIEKLRRAGAALTIDFSHSFIALKTIQEVALLAPMQKRQASLLLLLQESDLAHAQDADRFAEIVLGLTQPHDIWHVNDARGVYQTPAIHGTSQQFTEGVNLLEGDIPQIQLKRLIRYGLENAIKFVVEVHETDFIQNPNTRKSLAVVLNL